MNLLNKYNVPVPRYTSYPTVPAWHKSPSEGEWKQQVKKTFDAVNSAEGISLYIHLPFCESLCTYCACNTRITVNHKVEAPYIDAVLAEWQMYLSVFKDRPVLKELHLGGGTPTFFRPENLERLIDGILAYCDIHPSHDFSFEGHPANTSGEHLQTLADLGFSRVSFGIQDFDPKVQEVINRYQSFEQVQKVVSDARECGYSSLNFDLVYGLPLQTHASVSQTIKKVLALKPDRIAFYSYAHVPWIKPGQRKFTEKDLPQDEEKRALYEAGKKAFVYAGYSDIGMDHFALPDDPLFIAAQNKQLHRNFMGYTDKRSTLLLGLGVSSISDSWNCFSQNIKTVEAYQEKVSKGELPITKGHVLSEEDLQIRQHILNIMCFGSTRWEENQTALLKTPLEKLCELEQDGLVNLGKNQVIVTETGKNFLRNICACFDLYLLKGSQEKTFSSAA